MSAFTHLFWWLTFAPWVARKREAASFPAPAALWSKQFPTEKPWTLLECYSNHTLIITSANTFPTTLQHYTLKPTRKTLGISSPLPTLDCQMHFNLVITHLETVKRILESGNDSICSVTSCKSSSAGTVSASALGKATTTYHLLWRKCCWNLIQLLQVQPASSN